MCPGRCALPTGGSASGAWVATQSIEHGTHAASQQEPPGEFPAWLLLAAPAAHHRLVWIHPFFGSNCRVARLMSHATLLEALDTGAVWSAARGLARNVAAYKSRLAARDMTRRNDLDGRGNLSEEALAEFTQFFLGTCLDQLTFMEKSSSLA